MKDQTKWTILVSVLIGIVLIIGINTIQTNDEITNNDPYDIITLGTFDHNVKIGDRIYMIGTIIDFPDDSKYDFHMITPSGRYISWGYKSTTTNPTGIVPFNFYVSEFGVHTFKMTHLSDGSFVASEEFVLTEKL